MRRPDTAMNILWIMADQMRADCAGCPWRGVRERIFDDPRALSIREALREQLLNWQIRSNDNRGPQRSNSYFRSFFHAR